MSGQSWSIHIETAEPASESQSGKHYHVQETVQCG